MTAPFQSPNPAVAAVNALLTSAGLDMTTEDANPSWYANLHRQQAEQVAFAMLPVKHHRDAPRLMAEHLFWLTRAKRWRKDGWPWRYETQENLARALYAPAVDTIKKASTDLKKAGMIDNRKAFMPGTSTAVTHYRLTDEAHIVLALLTLAGVEDLTQREWLELILPTDPEAKPLRDVLAGWQEVDCTAKLDALQQAIGAAVLRVAGDTKGHPRLLYEAWRKAVKLEHPDPGPFSATQRKRLVPILKELKQAAAEPGASFKYDPSTLATFATRIVKDWASFQALAKADKAKKLPPVPDLDTLAWHIPLALSVAFGGGSVPSVGLQKAAGWD